MAFVERIAQRALNSVTLIDEANPIRHRLVASSVPLHYDDGSATLNRINMTPVRIRPGDWQKYPNFDGWLVSQNGWLYGLGADGYVYFGGRRGQHYVRFRLREVGYVRTTTGAFTAISGLPAYNTANLGANQTQTTIEGETYVTGTTAEWRNLNTTPGGGELFLRFKARGDGLKAEYVINQAAREWIIANRPPSSYGIPAAQAYLAFRFDIDFSDIPRKLVNGVLQGDTFDDANGGVELRNAIDELLAFMPVEAAYVDTGDDLFRSKVALRKRFAGNVMTIGAPVSALNALPAGDLVFDPTVTPSVSTGADDWTWITATNFGNTEAGAIYGYYLATYLVHLGLRFAAVNVPKDSTINTCYVTGVASASFSGTMSAVRVDFVAADNPAAPGNYTDAEAQTGTGSYANWTPGAQTAGTGYNTPSLVTPAQAIVNRAGWASGQAMIVIIKAVTASNNYRSMASENHATYAAPLLYIDYTPPSQSSTVGKAAGTGAGKSTTPSPGAASMSAGKGSGAGVGYGPGAVGGATSITAGKAAGVGVGYDPGATGGAISQAVGKGAAVGAGYDPTAVANQSGTVGKGAGVGTGYDGAATGGATSIAVGRGAGVGAGNDPTAVGGAVSETIGKGAGTGVGYDASASPGAASQTVGKAAGEGVGFDPFAVGGATSVAIGKGAGVGAGYDPVASGGAVSQAVGKAAGVGAGYDATGLQGVQYGEAGKAAAVAAGYGVTPSGGATSISAGKGQAEGVGHNPTAVSGAISQSVGKAAATGAGYNANATSDVTSSPVGKGSGTGQGYDATATGGSTSVAVGKGEGVGRGIQVVPVPGAITETVGKAAGVATGYDVTATPSATVGVGKAAGIGAGYSVITLPGGTVIVVGIARAVAGGLQVLGRTGEYPRFGVMVITNASGGAVEITTVSESEVAVTDAASGSLETT